MGDFYEQKMDCVCSSFFTVINMDNLIAKGDCEQQVILESARYSYMNDINVIDINNGLLPANDGNWYYYVEE